MYYYHKDGHTDQWNRIEIPKIVPNILGDLILNKGANAIQR